MGMLRVKALVAQMNELASYTCDRIVFSTDRGFAFREDSITEHNLFELARERPALLVKRFNGTDESANGADWEWWVGGADQGWVCLRIQAKKLSGDGVYREISYRTANRLQYELLMESCADDSRAYRAPILPFYCFYNGWGKAAVEWPQGVPNLICPKGAVPPRCVHAQLRDYGCAIAPASATASVHRGRSGSQTTLGGHLATSRPWSSLFITRWIKADDRGETPVPAATGTLSKGVLADLTLLGVPGSRTASSTATSPVDRWRSLPRNGAVS